MGLISIFLSGAGAIAVAVAADLIAAEVKGWTPGLTERLVCRAGKRLPEGEIRERFLEEWRSHVADTPGHLGKFCVAFDAARGANKIARAARGTGTVWAEKTLDYIAYQGTRVVQRSLFKVLERELAARLPPQQVLAVTRLVRDRFEPKLRGILRNKMTHIGNYRQTAREIENLFASVLSDLSAEAHQRGLPAILGDSVIPMPTIMNQIKGPAPVNQATDHGDR